MPPSSFPGSAWGTHCARRKPPARSSPARKEHSAVIVLERRNSILVGTKPLNDLKCRMFSKPGLDKALVPSWKTAPEPSFMSLARFEKQHVPRRFVQQPNQFYRVALSPHGVVMQHTQAGHNIVGLVRPAKK